MKTITKTTTYKITIDDGAPFSHNATSAAVAVEEIRKRQSFGEPSISTAFGGGDRHLLVTSDAHQIVAEAVS